MAMCSGPTDVLEEERFQGPFPTTTTEHARHSAAAGRTATSPPAAGAPEYRKDSEASRVIGLVRRTRPQRGICFRVCDPNHVSEPEDRIALPSPVKHCRRWGISAYCGPVCSQCRGLVASNSDPVVPMVRSESSRWRPWRLLVFCRCSRPAARVAPTCQNVSRSTARYASVTTNR